MRNAEKVGFTTRKPETTFEELLNAIWDSVSNLAISDDGEDGEAEGHDEEDSEQGTPSEDDEPGWVICTISKTVQPRTESFLQMPCSMTI